MKFHPFCFLALLLLLLSTGICHAKTPFILLAVPEEGYGPYIIIKNKEVTGILIDVLLLAAKQVPMDVVFEYMPEKRSRVMLNSGNIDARMESPRWISDPGDYLWSEPIVNINDMFIYHRMIGDVFETDADMNGVMLITHLGYSYPTLQSLFDERRVTRVDFSTEVGMLNRLNRPNGRFIEAAVMDKHVALWLIRHNPVFQGMFKFSKRIVDSTPLHIQFSASEKMKKWLPILNKKIKELKESGVVGTIIKDTLNY